ncbi:MAG TPA: LysM peptidoglycan-binding domain-containing protein [Vicinamibacteria bacterium]|nr:LysM peptidoglycan-binding domain-containing protein [Vicinamibacteria bacterium]
MGLFDKKSESKSGAAVADPQPQLAALKQKYQSVLTFMEQRHVKVQNLHVENGKLVIRAMAPSEEVKNKVWDQIKLVDSGYRDLSAEVTVAPGQGGPSGEAASPAVRTYTVKAGDTLSGISQQFYGNANQYNKIFEANRDKLSDPDKIKPGQELKIPV